MISNGYHGPYAYKRMSNFEIIFFHLQITCEALGAHPAPQLSWVEPPEADVDITAQPQINSHDKTTDIRHTIKYKANLKDNGLEIKCIGTQVTRDGRTVLYEKTARVTLKVEKLILPIDNALTQKIGIISGVLLAVIFLILLCVFVIFAVCKRRRKRSRPPSSTATDDTSPEEPPIKPIWTTPMAQNNTKTNGGGPIIQHQKHQKQRYHHGHMSNTVSQATVSTVSTGSNTSWEDRSVGGEVEEPSVQRYQKISPSLHETHFEGGDLGSDLDLPRTVLHHPDPFAVQRAQRPSYAGRPSSSMLEQNPMYNHSRPQSALETPNYLSHYPMSVKRMPTPNGPMTTSVKSVFDCDLGCFIEDHELVDHDLVDHDHNMSSTKASPSKSEKSQSPMTPTSPVSRTSEPHDV
jgi:hypothetical protein